MDENDRALFVVPAGDQVVFRSLDRPADIADAHGRAVAVGNDQVVVSLGLQQLIVGIEREALLRTVERSLGEIDIGLTQHVAHVFKADAAIGERLRIDLDTDRRLLLSADADEADARDLRELRHEDALGKGVDRGQWQRIGGEGKDEDRRICRVHLADGRWIGDADGQIRTSGVDRRQDILGRAIDIAAKVKLDGELGDAKRAR